MYLILVYFKTLDMLCIVLTMNVWLTFLCLPYCIRSYIRLPIIGDMYFSFVYTGVEIGVWCTMQLFRNMYVLAANACVRIWHSSYAYKCYVFSVLD